MGFSDPNYGVKVLMAPDTVELIADQAHLAPLVSDDVALLHLPTGLLMNGSRTNYTFPGFHSNPASLVGSDIVCKGYGFDHIDLATLIESGGGILETGTSVMSDVIDPYVFMMIRPPPNTPQIPLHGDSGAGCTFNNLVVGVMSRRVDISAGLVNASRYSLWAQLIMATP